LRDGCETEGKDENDDDDEKTREGEFDGGKMRARARGTTVRSKWRETMSKQGGPEHRLRDRSLSMAWSRHFHSVVILHGWL
jgi:hypothetical protein